MKTVRTARKSKTTSTARTVHTLKNNPDRKSNLNKGTMWNERTERMTSTSQTVRSTRSTWVDERKTTVLSVWTAPTANTEQMA